HEEAPAPVADDEAGDRRVELVAHADDQVFELADHLAGLAPNRAIENRCKEKHGLPPMMFARHGGQTEPPTRVSAWGPGGGWDHDALDTSSHKPAPVPQTQRALRQGPP